jgi:tetratricopeptide (TPR) repeat protein
MRNKKIFLAPLLLLLAVQACSTSSGAKNKTNPTADAEASAESKNEAKVAPEVAKSPKGEQKFVTTTLTPAQTFQKPLVGNDLTSAIMEVEESVRKAPDDVPMVVTYLALLRLAGNGGDVQKSLAKSAGAKGAKSPWFLLESGYGALTRREFALADYLFGKADRFSSGDALVKAAVNHAFGIRLMMIGRQADGIYEIRKAASANFGPALVTLGYLGLRSGDYAGAERNFRAALASDGESFNAKMGLGISLRVRGRADEAYPLIAQVLKQRPNDRRVHWDYALALSEAPGKKAEAVELLSKYFQLPGSLGDIDAKANALYQKLQAELKAPPPAAPASAAPATAAPATAAQAPAAQEPAAVKTAKTAPPPPSAAEKSSSAKAKDDQAEEGSTPQKTKEVPKAK